MQHGRRRGGMEIAGLCARRSTAPCPLFAPSPAKDPTVWLSQPSPRKTAVGSCPETRNHNPEPRNTEALRWLHCGCFALHPQPSTLNPKPSTLIAI